jgi:hypothetical protein
MHTHEKVAVVHQAKPITNHKTLLKDIVDDVKLGLKVSGWNTIIC